MNSKRVKVRAGLDSAGNVDFDIDGVKAKQSKFNLKKDSGSHAIAFDLHDHTALGLQFDQVDPIWVGENSPCPPASGINSDQLSVTSCSSERLSTLNRNSGDPRELRYQLNFIARDGARHTCDPIIRNGGGRPD